MRREPSPLRKPPWWTPAVSTRATLLALAATGSGPPTDATGPRRRSATSARAPRNEARSGPLPAATAARLAAGVAPEDLLAADAPEPERVAAALAKAGSRFVIPGDDGWPFDEMQPDPPCAWLFVAGPDLPPAPAAVAIVGGRRASARRCAFAADLAGRLARAGYCVVSGGAVGIDAAAHAGSCAAGGQTVVVLGCGLGFAYPRSNASLFDRIRCAGGTFVSEHPPGARPWKHHFVPRNRLIAALAGAVVVVEAAERSGSLSTARFAGSRGAGRLLAVPGAPWDAGAAGCNQLIRDGAMLVNGPLDVLRELGGAIAGEVPALPRTGPATRRRDRASGLVVDALVDYPALSVAELQERTGLGQAALARALFELELDGTVRRAGVVVELLGGR